MDPPLTLLLQRASTGETKAAEELLPLVYDQLRRSAEAAMRHERPGHTLQATALVHDAYVRLVGENAAGESGGWSGRAHFYHAAGRAMRQLLIEHARAKGRVKRGGDGAAGSAPRHVPLDVVDLAADADPAELLALDEAVSQIESLDPEVAAVVRLRFYAGLSGDQTAEALGISPRQVDRLWAYARAVIVERVRRGERGEG